MGDGYKHQPQGEAAMRKLLREQQQQIDALRSAAASKSTIIGAGGLQVKDQGSIKVLDQGTIEVLGTDSYTVIDEGGVNVGALDAAGVFWTPPNMVLRPDGFVAANAEGDIAVFRIDEVGNAVLTSSIQSVLLPYQSTASAANTRILLNGQIQMVTSSLRFKQDIEDAEIDPETVLKLRGRTWRSRDDVEKDPETDVRYVGFIAEEVDEAGLGIFVDYDDEGPFAIQYDRISVALLSLARSQQQRLDKQQQQIDDLTARLDALEGK